MTSSGFFGHSAVVGIQLDRSYVDFPKTRKNLGADSSVLPAVLKISQKYAFQFEIPLYYIVTVSDGFRRFLTVPDAF